jgi:hypothetical protein
MVRAVLAYVARDAPAADVGDLVSEVFATALVHRSAPAGAERWS